MAGHCTLHGRIPHVNRCRISVQLSRQWLQATPMPRAEPDCVHERRSLPSELCARWLVVECEAEASDLAGIRQHTKFGTTQTAWLGRTGNRSARHCKASAPPRARIRVASHRSSASPSTRLVPAWKQEGLRAQAQRTMPAHSEQPHRTASSTAHSSGRTARREPRSALYESYGNRGRCGGCAHGRRASARRKQRISLRSRRPRAASRSRCSAPTALS